MSALRYNGHIPHAHYVMPHHDISQLSSLIFLMLSIPLC